jgi:hypothetical protein
MKGICLKQLKAVEIRRKKSKEFKTKRAKFTIRLQMVFNTITQFMMPLFFDLIAF